MRDGLWGIVNRTEIFPEAKTECYAKLITHRDSALAAIVLSIDPSLLYFLRDPTNPAAVWDKLLSQFQGKM